MHTYMHKCLLTELHARAELCVSVQLSVCLPPSQKENGSKEANGIEETKREN